MKKKLLKIVKILLKVVRLVYYTLIIFAIRVYYWLLSHLEEWGYIY